MYFLPGDEAHSMYEPRIFSQESGMATPARQSKLPAQGNKDNITQYYSLPDDNIYRASDAR